MLQALWNLLGRKETTDVTDVPSNTVFTGQSRKSTVDEATSGWLFTSVFNLFCLTEICENLTGKLIIHKMIWTRSVYTCFACISHIKTNHSWPALSSWVWQAKAPGILKLHCALDCCWHAPPTAPPVRIGQSWVHSRSPKCESMWDQQKGHLASPSSHVPQGVTNTINPQRDTNNIRILIVILKMFKSCYFYHYH